MENFYRRIDSLSQKVVNGLEGELARGQELEGSRGHSS